jgi:hypothetical protein
MVKLPENSPHAWKHSQMDPGSDCPGPISIRAQKSDGRGGVRDEWTCDRCGGNNYGAWRNRRIDQQTADGMGSEINTMKLKLCVHRKAGAPGYGSEGAGAEVELDLDDDLAGEPAKLVAFAQIWYGSLERAVDDQLARMTAKHATAAPAIAPPAPAPRSSQGPPEGLEEYGYEQAARDGGERRNGSGAGNGYGTPPSRRNGVGGPPPSGGEGPPRNDPPKNGKQLIGWANGHGKYDELMKLSKAWNLGRIIDWTPDDVQAAHHELSRPATVGWGGGR